MNMALERSPGTRVKAAGVPKKRPLESSAEANGARKRAGSRNASLKKRAPGKAAASRARPSRLAPGNTVPKDAATPKAKSASKARARAATLPNSTPRYWLLKSEAECFGFDDLVRAPNRRTGWDGVRNYQARNFIRDSMSIGDLVLYYHSNAEPSGIAGIARIASAAHPDPTQFDPANEHFDPKSRREDPPWMQVEVEAVAKLPRFVSLEELKRDARLAKMLVLQRGQRLSVLPVEPGEWRVVLEIAGLAPSAF